MSSNFHDFNRNLVADVRKHGKPTSGPFLGRDVLILTTRGARSGEERSTPLVYSWDQGRHVIVASKGGAPTHPSWYHNLAAHPIVTVETGGESFQARARVVDGEDYERLYKQHADVNPTFWDYRKKTSRKIPVVVLERIEERKAG
jgi:deazaflavin-dependent oxidoreductase (nitroreductase family)